MNVCTLTGNAVKDFELRKTANGKSVTSNTIAVRRDTKDQNGDYPTDFINFVAWDHQADYLARYAKKGDRLELTGRWQVRKYQDQNGNNREANELVVSSATCYSTKREEPTEPSGQRVTIMREEPTNVIADDDLPF